MTSFKIFSGQPLARAGLFGAVLALVVAAGCHQPAVTPLPTPAPRYASADLAGTWRSTLDDGTLTLGPGGAFSVTWPTTGRTVRGTWAAADGVVSFVNAPGSAICPDVKGSYLYQVRGDTVTFSTISDDCQDRLDALRVPWVRLPPPKP